MARTPTYLASSLLLAWLWAGSLIAAEPVRSGLQPGEEIGSTFEPLNVTGPHAGEPHCLVCENGLSPVVMLFAREPSEPLMRLLAQVDAATARHRAQEMGSFVVFLNDRQELPQQLQEAARKHSLKHLIVSIDQPAGPEGFKVSPQADITVVLYSEHVVKANHAFGKGELTPKAIDGILADLPKILPPAKK
jgi:hypothetical protein